MHDLLKADWFDTKIGPMIAVADDVKLHLLEFVDRAGMEDAEQRLKRLITRGSSPVLNLIKKELSAYFEGTLYTFKTPVAFQGTPFQKQVWEALLEIPYGQTRSYAEMARVIGMPTAFRAVANANRSNALSIIVPCHRVIKSNGDLCGYGGGVARKEWLLHHEKTG